jgi:hypothetical protein
VFSMSKLKSKKQSNGALTAGAHERVKAELAALDRTQLRNVNVSVNDAAELLLAAARRVEPLLPRLAVALPQFDQEILLRVQDYTLVLMEAHARCMLPPLPDVRHLVVAPKALELLRVLRMEVNLLAMRGLVDPKRVPRRQSVGYQKMSEELSLLSVLLYEVWPNIQGKTGLTEADVQEAERLSVALLEPPPESLELDAAKDLRGRAFTAVVACYEEQLRPALVYVRRAIGDADELAPSLFKPRARKPSRVSNVEVR